MKEMKFSELCRSQLFWQQVKAFVTGEVRLSSGFFWAKASVENNCIFCREMHSRQVQTLLLVQVLFFSLGSKTFGTQCMDELTGVGLWEEDSASQLVHFKQLHQDSFTSFSYLQSLDGEYLLVRLEKRDFLRHDVIFAKGKHMWSSAVQNNTEVPIAELSVM